MWQIITRNFILSFYFQCLYSTTNCEYKTILDFPGGPVVKNLHANAGNMGSIPDPGRSVMPRGNWTHAPQRLSLCPGACEPQLLSLRVLEPVLCNKRSHGNEKLAHGQQRGAPSSPQSEKAHGATRPSRAKNKTIKLNFKNTTRVYYNKSIKFWTLESLKLFNIFVSNMWFKKVIQVLGRRATERKSNHISNFCNLKKKFLPHSFFFFFCIHIEEHIAYQGQ